MEYSIINLISLTVPTPLLSVSVIPLSNHYAGSSLKVTCSAQLATEIDVPVVVIPAWTKNNMQLPNTTRVSTIDSGGPGSLMNNHTLSFTTLSGAVDTGEYQCLILLVTSSYSPFVQPSPPVNTTVNVNVLGED